MKISALASLLGVTATTLLPGVSASESESSLRGKAILPGEVDLLELGFQCGNWNSDKCSGTGGNTCYRVTTQCTNICDCKIDYATSKCVEGTCVAYGQPVPSPPSPTPPQRVSCRTGANECASGQWCETSLYGQCYGGQGQCSYYLGGACNYDNNPVCGCDGKTYANECQATNAGVNVDYAGSCYNDRTCQVGQKNACPNGQWCRAFSSSNDQCAGQGTCSYYLGGSCPSSYKPVCGCDGNTYDNECKATNAGVNVDYQGACSDCGLSHNGSSGCPSGQWCKALNSPGQCAVGSPGMCTYFTGDCNTKNYDPVCGCDWKTYDNPCKATAGGVNIQHYGAC